MLRLVPLVGIPHEVVDGGVEVVGQALQDFQFRLSVVVFLLFDGGLGDKYGLREALLTDAILLPQGFQVFQHGATPPGFRQYYINNRRVFYDHILNKT